MTTVKSEVKLVLASFILLFLAFGTFAYADGVAHVYDPQLEYWKIQDEGVQLCAINYENGFENMILSVDFSGLHGEKAVWIFPVPAKPNETEVDVIKGFPSFHGQSLKEKVDDTISDTFDLMRVSQIYPFFSWLLTPVRPGAAGIGMKEGVKVYEHMEKRGLTVEVVTAEDGESFSNYLVNKGLDLPVGSKSVLDEYIGKKYSFVVYWISDIEKFKQQSALYWNPEAKEEYFRKGYPWSMDKDYNEINLVGVFVRFPTDKMYFPLKPTSVYGYKEIPIRVYVMGYVTPEIYPEIGNDTDTEYLFGSYDVPEELSPFFNGKKGTQYLEYTEIDIEAPSKHFTKDLWIEDSPPARVVTAKLANKYFWLWGAIVFAIASCLASLLAGITVFKWDKPNKKKFALFGLWNFLTLTGFTIAAYLGKIDSGFTRSRENRENRISFKTSALALFIAIALSCLVSYYLFSYHLFSPFGYQDLMYSLVPLIYAAMIAPFFTVMGFAIALLLSKNGSELVGIKEYLDKKVLFKSVALALLASFVICLLIPPMFMIYLIITLLFLPFIWGYYQNKRILGFVVIFTVFFMIISLILQNVMLYLI